MNKHLLMKIDIDSTLEQVVGDWLPRMQAAGISPTLVIQLIEKVQTWSNWCRVWSQEANAQEKLGVKAESQGHMVTAGEAYLHASLLYHYAQFMFFEDLKQKHDAAEHKITLYQSAAPFLQPASTYIEIPYKEGSLKGYLRGFGPKRPNVVILVPGINSTKEEFSAFEKFLLNRDLATLSIDGPGQGEGRDFGPLTPDWEPPIRAIINTLRSLEGVGRIGLIGMALGGHLALRAAHISDLDAVVSLNGFFDMGAFWDTLPDVYLSNMRYMLDCDSLEELAKPAKDFTLQDIAPPSCPTLVIHGMQDKVFAVEDAEKIGPWSQGKADMRILKDGTHLCTNVAHIYRPMIADWFADKLR